MLQWNNPNELTIRVVVDLHLVGRGLVVLVAAVPGGVLVVPGGRGAAEGELRGFVRPGILLRLGGLLVPGRRAGQVGV